MPKEDPQASSEAAPKASYRGRVTVVLLALVLTLLVGIGFVVSRGEDAISSAPSTGRPAGNATTTVATAVSKETEVTSRLSEILEVRDRALASRDSMLLNDIYTVDCKCLEDGRSLIRQLREEKVVWKGVTTNITIDSTEELNGRLWIIIATVQTPPVRIETETGRLIRIVPAERNVVRFALAKPQNEDEWLLGHASSVG
jgi:hypothetical protein